MRKLKANLLDLMLGAYLTFIFGAIAWVLLTMSSCTTTRYVPVETVRTEIKQIHDTVTIKDSIKKENQIIIREADSAEIERLNTEYGFKLNKAQRTIMVLQKKLEYNSHNQAEVRDSIVYKEKEVQVPYPVEKKLSKWQQLKIDFGEVFILVIFVFSMVSILLLYLRQKR